MHGSALLNYVTKLIISTFGKIVNSETFNKYLSGGGENLKWVTLAAFEKYPSVGTKQGNYSS